MGLLLALMPTDAVSVPGRDGVYSVLWPLAPVLVGTWAVAGLRSAFLDCRLASVRRLSDRACVAAILVCGAHLTVFAAPGYQHVVLHRNLAFTLGAAMASVCLLPRSSAWIPIVIPPMVMWLMGTRSVGPPRPWAVLLRPETDHTAMSVAVFLYGAGAFLFLRAATVRGPSGPSPAPR